jgi:hypothetical protein
MFYFFLYHFIEISVDSVCEALFSAGMLILFCHFNNYISNQLKIFKTYKEAKEYVLPLGLKNVSDWKQYSKSGLRPEDIPSHPQDAYKEDWIGWGDFFGTGEKNYKNIKNKSFDEARKYVHNLNLNTGDEWREYCKSGKKPFDIPSFPNRIYKENGWISMGDWLGTGKVSNKLRKYLPYYEAIKIVHSLNLNNGAEWLLYCRSKKKPSNIPSNPQDVYENNGWISMGEWLGTFNTANYLKEYRTYEQAREFVHRLKLKSFVEWRKYCISGKKPKDIPASPHKTYKGRGWNGNAEWLGTKNIANRLKVFLPLSEAKIFVQSLGIKSSFEWRLYCKSDARPDNIPSDPFRVYKNQGWKNLADFFGYDKEK